MESTNKTPQILLIPTRVLLIVAALVWFAAGAGVVSVGLAATTQAWNWWMGLACLIVFTAFLMLFLLLSRRNAQRILAKPEKLSFLLHFFDANSYIIMVLMIFLGTAVRLSTFVPDPYIAFFYCGLGAALILAGFYLLVIYIRTWESPHFK
jgi:hypothetical protein